MTDPRLLLFLLLFPFLGSLVAAMLPTRGRNLAAILASIPMLAGLAILAFTFPQIRAGVPLVLPFSWMPTFGLDLVLRLDGLSWFFAALILGIGFLVVLYARYYMAATDPVPRFFSFLLAFAGSMLGLVLSGNLIQLAFFFELTGLFSFLLIGYWHHNESARDGARMSLIVTASGGVALLLGFLLIGRIAATYDLVQLWQMRDVVQSHPLYPAALVLVLAGAFTKSAQLPFHFWLPHAMAAPTPVSAYLHSATLVKAGIFVLLRLWPVMAGSDLWFQLVTGAGLVTLLVGAWSAIFQRDLKGLLAYSTISHLGLITLLLGLGSPLGAVAAIFHTANHATFKASLFMATGVIDHETGTRDIRRLSGLASAMPLTATLAMVAAAAMAGVPLLNGFLSKEMFLAEARATHSGTVLDLLLPTLATVASAFAVLYSLRFIHQTFFGPPATDLPKQPHEAPAPMLLPIGILVALCLLVGIFPAVTIGPALDVAVHSVLGDQAPEYSLAIWHGFTTPMLMSLTALVVGTWLYIRFGGRLNRLQRSPVIGRLRGRRIFERVLAFFIAGATFLRDLLGTGRLQAQLRLLLLAALVAGLLPFLGGWKPDAVAETPQATMATPLFALLWLIGGSCALAAAYMAKYHRLVAVILVGGAGLVTVLSFVWLSAPDLGLTQLLVEIVTTLLLLIGLRWLPKRRADHPPEQQGLSARLRAQTRRGTDLLIAACAGLGVAALSYRVMMEPQTATIAHYFTRNAYPGGGGSNVVNVILVDFRGLDTMGEITVLAIVALTVFSLLRRFRPAPDSIELPMQQQMQDAYDFAQADRALGDTIRHYLFVPRVLMEWLFPFVLAFALYLLLRGHDLPGGGFAAGVAASIGIILLYMASGTRSVEARLRVRPMKWIGFGLLLAGGTGIGAMLSGRPFLTSAHGTLPLPLVGDLHWTSALFFDLGVFAVVVGSTVLNLIALAHQSIRSPQAADTADRLERGTG